MRARRIDPGLLVKDVSERIDVDPMTISNWERNATVPATRQIPAIVRFLGYDPLPPAHSLPEKLLRARRLGGLSHREMALKLGVDPTTVLDWEAGRHQPTGRSKEKIEKVLRSGDFEVDDTACKRTG